MKAGANARSWRDAILLALAQGPRTAEEIATVVSRTRPVGAEARTALDNVYTYTRLLRIEGRVDLLQEKRRVARAGRYTHDEVSQFALAGTAPAVPYAKRVRRNVFVDAPKKPAPGRSKRRSAGSGQVAGPCMSRSFKWSEGMIW